MVAIYISQTDTQQQAERSVSSETKVDTQKMGVSHLLSRLFCYFRHLPTHFRRLCQPLRTHLHPRWLVALLRQSTRLGDTAAPRRNRWLLRELGIPSNRLSAHKTPRHDGLARARRRYVAAGYFHAGGFCKSVDRRGTDGLYALEIR